MWKLLPPLLFFLALLAFIAAFAFLAVGPPDPGMALHQARLSGDEQYREMMERQYQWRLWRRRALIGVLFAAGGVLTLGGFAAMRPE